MIVRMIGCTHLERVDVVPLEEGGIYVIVILENCGVSPLTCKI